MEPTSDECEIIGRLFAPETAAGIPCSVRVTAAGFHAAAGDATCQLPFDATELSFGGHRDSMLLVEQHTRAGKLSLYIPAPQAMAQLRSLGDPEVDRRLQVLIHGRRGAMFGSWRQILIGLGVIVALFWITNLGVNLVIDWGIERVPVAWEVELGKQLVDSMLQGQITVDDPVVTEGVQQVAARLLEHLEDSGYPFQIRVIDDTETINAFAAPGGQIIVTTGILGACDSPEVLAGVLAHEVQHVRHRHSLRQMAHQLKWRVAASIIVGEGDWLMDLILSEATQAVTLTHAADAERQADRDGLKLLREAEIDPAGMVTFFTKLKDEVEGPEHSQPMFSTHPPTSERIAYLQAMIDEDPDHSIVPIEVDWYAVQAAAK